MDKIEVKILNPEQLHESEEMMVAMARLTQRGHKITCMDDLLELIHKPYKKDTAEAMAKLPHPTIQKFGLINIAIVGASRRFLGQITRHQNEIKFMSGSLQYSDYSDAAQFCVPYGITKMDKEHPIDSGYGPEEGYYRMQYINSCLQSLDDYKKAIEYGQLDNDSAGYMMPQGMRNVLIMSVLPYELKHIISQRTCNRNTLETQYVLLKIWEELYDWPMFKDCGPTCMQRAGCQEGHMSCGRPLYSFYTPTDILNREFKYIRRL